MEDGQTDVAFNGSGMFTEGWTNDSNVYGLAVQPDDKILAVGGPTVWRLGTNGLPDSTFGPGGMATTAGQFWDITRVHKAGPDAFVTAARAYVTRGRSTTSLWALWRCFY